MLSAFYLTFRRANLSLMGCTSAEPISVSVRSKVQRIKLYLQTVEIPNHFQYYIGEKASNCIKLDLYYTDKFMDDIVLMDNIRLASVAEIIAMKIDVIIRTGRKKDFWDIHEIMKSYSIQQMAELHEKRYPYSHSLKELKEKLMDFSGADDDFDPVCLRNAHWELIKLDMIDLSNELVLE